MANQLRNMLADALTSAISAKGYKWVVESGRQAPRQIAKTTLLLRQATIEKHPVAPLSVRLTGFELFLLHPGKNETTIDDLLEPLADNLLDILDTDLLPGLTWTRAERVIFTVSPDVEFHGYKVDLTVTNTKG